MSLNSTLGVLLISVVVGATLHGVSCVQAWYYYTHQNDSWRLKTLVGVVMISDTVHQALVTHGLYVYTVLNWGDPTILPKLAPTIIIEVFFNGLTAFLVQTFLAVRVWRLSNKNIWISTFIALLVLGELGVSLAYGVKGLAIHTFAGLAEIQGLSLSINALAAAGDVSIAATLCIILQRSKTGFHRSDTLVNRIIVFAINTGVLTSLCALASLITINAAPTTFIYIGFYFCIGRLYTNSLLATLNARRRLRDQSAIHGSGSESLGLRDMHSARKPQNISIKIDTTQTKQFTMDAERAEKYESIKSAGV